MDSIDIRQRPELQELAKHLRETRRVTVLRDADEEIATITPIRSKQKRRSRIQPVAEDDPIFDLIGIGESTVPGGISDKKHEYLLDAYREHHSSEAK